MKELVEHVTLVFHMSILSPAIGYISIYLI